MQWEPYSPEYRSKRKSKQSEEISQHNIEINAEWGKRPTRTAQPCCRLAESANVSDQDDFDTNEQTVQTAA